MSESTIKNPYEGLAENQLFRTSIVLSGNDAAFIAGIHRRKGTLQDTCAVLLTKFIEQLKQHGITSYDPDAYESAVCAIAVRIGTAGSTCTNPQPNNETVDRNDRPGATSVAPVTPRQTNEPRNTRVSPASKRRQQGKTTKARH